MAMSEHQWMHCSLSDNRQSYQQHNPMIIYLPPEEYIPPPISSSPSSIFTPSVIPDFKHCIPSGWYINTSTFWKCTVDPSLWLVATVYQPERECCLQTIKHYPWLLPMAPRQRCCHYASFHAAFFGISLEQGCWTEFHHGLPQALWLSSKGQLYLHIL